MPKSKARLDQLLVESGFAENRQKAHALILAGRVFVGSNKIEKPGTLVSSTAAIEVRRSPRFVSRGGEKLQRALEFFQIPVRDRVCVDLGSSTGGFVDCLLQNGACHVYAFDVGRGQIAWRLATDPRVTLRDQFNVRYLNPENLPRSFFLMTVDVSFISLRRIVPAIAAGFQAKGEADSLLLLLVKPQFELPPDRIARGGLVENPEEGRSVVQRVVEAGFQAGFVDPEVLPCPILGAEGNQEYFVRLTRAANERK